MKKTMLCATLVALTATSSFAGDWPQFCGPDRNNISSETGLADSWPEGGPKVLWEKTISDGYSSSAIKDGKVYFVDRVGDKSVLLVLDLAKGTELWKCELADPGNMSHAQYAGTRGTPSVTDDAVYFVTGWGTLVCVDFESKAIRWEHNLLEEFGMSLHMWGMSQSPVVYKDLIIVAPTADEVGVVAYKKKDGELAWKSKPIGGYSFASPVVYKICGVDMLVAVGSEKSAGGGGRPGRTGRGAAPAPAAAAPASTEVASGTFGLSLDDGSVLWSYGGWQGRNAIPFPTAIPGDRLFITGGYGAGSAMVRIEKSDDGYKVVELFKTKDIGPQIHQAVYFKDRLLVANNDNGLSDGLICATLDGKLEWRTKDIAGAPNFERGPFIVADDKIIILDAKTGKLHLVKGDLSSYQELASAQMVKANDMAWAPLALSDGKLIVRDWKTLKCVDLK
ncbi:MAG: PQQ-binding-like beta-propeller repeat protein [Pontiellaceae bacterium]|nr:PQQ-binding-like beta-propeller repeat protein [Pontiellaceae bacterium]